VVHQIAALAEVAASTVQQAQAKGAGKKVYRNR
jgi:hypothetical protein